MKIRRSYHVAEINLCALWKENLAARLFAKSEGVLSKAVTFGCVRLSSD